MTRWIWTKKSGFHAGYITTCFRLGIGVLAKQEEFHEVQSCQKRLCSLAVLSVMNMRVVVDLQPFIM